MPSSTQPPSKTPPPEDSLKPIPAFYCCYLLRSTVRHASLYIGSTPDPARRLAQHNGDKNGGAKRTSREKLRPWEMVAIVSGFMSRAGALQFEWAWQHTRDSRHAGIQEMNSAQASNVRTCPRTGKEIRRPAKPGTSLSNILANLHLLLRSTYFSAWPLEVRFFAPDVYRAWQGWVDRADGLLSDGIKVVVDFKPDVVRDVEREMMGGGTGSVSSLDIGYDRFKTYVEKTQFLLGDGERVACGVCRGMINLRDDIVVVCSHDVCHCACHLLCLSSRFLEGEELHSKLVPTGGKCPACRLRLEWPVLMKEITLRLRGESEVKKLFRRRGGRGSFKKPDLSPSEDESDASKDNTDAETVDMTSCDELGEEDGLQGEPMSETDFRGNIDSDDDSVRTITPRFKRYTQSERSTKAEERKPKHGVVADSFDWDDVEIID
ncbi:Slx4p interacting protein [Onygenales sp. PD_12]|nr:Slx4p interacting protein [Onygenales sp. PD_12]